MATDSDSRAILFRRFDFLSTCNIIPLFVFQWGKLHPDTPKKKLPPNTLNLQKIFKAEIEVGLKVVLR